MSSERFFLDNGGLRNHEGLASTLNLTFDDEKTLDEKLWFDPENALDTAKSVIRQNKGELTPVLARIGLKSLALPLFKREFAREEPLLGLESDETKSAEYAAHLEMIDAEIEGVGDRTVRLIDRYLEYLEDEDVDQEVLEQAITDAVVFQLIVRNTDDIVLLPISPDSLTTPVATSFTVLRRKSLGRAHLIVNNGAKVSHIHNPNVLRSTIQLSTNDIIGPNGDIIDLAEALVNEYDDAYDTELEMITAADARLRAKINAHFDSIESK